MMFHRLQRLGIVGRMIGTLALLVVVSVPWLAAIRFQRLTTASFSIQEQGSLPGPYDLVLTWTNTSDPEYISQLFSFANDAPTDRIAAEDIIRNESEDFFLYALRSVARYTDWFRSIIIITNGQIPEWLNAKHPKIRLLSHQDIWEDLDQLPVFNLSSVQAHLSKIPNLSRFFVYADSEMFFLRNVASENFFPRDRGVSIRTISKSTIDCAPGCLPFMQGDGICQDACFRKSCDNDSGDCKKRQTISSHEDDDFNWKEEAVRNSHREIERVLGFPHIKPYKPQPVPMGIDLYALRDIEAHISPLWEQTASTRFASKESYDLTYLWTQWLLFRKHELEPEEVVSILKKFQTKNKSELTIRQVEEFFIQVIPPYIRKLKEFNTGSSLVRYFTTRYMNNPFHFNHKANADKKEVRNSQFCQQPLISKLVTQHYEQQGGTYMTHEYARPEKEQLVLQHNLLSNAIELTTLLIRKPPLTTIKQLVAGLADGNRVACRRMVLEYLDYELYVPGPFERIDESNWWRWWWIVNTKPYVIAVEYILGFCAFYCILEFFYQEEDYDCLRQRVTENKLD